MPPPGALKQFEEILPGMTERLLGLVEREQAHRIAVETKLVDHDTAIERLGQRFGAATHLVCIAAALASVWLGAHWAVSIAFLGIPTASVIRTFLARRGMNGK